MGRERRPLQVVRRREAAYTWDIFQKLQFIRHLKKKFLQQLLEVVALISYSTARYGKNAQNSDDEIDSELKSGNSAGDMGL